MGVRVPSWSPAAATMILKTEPGAYWVWIVAIQQGMGRILDDGQPCRAVDGAGEAVDVEGRRGDHGQHVAVARIHDHHRPRVAVHGSLGRLLDAAIDGGDDLCPGQWLRCAG